MLIRFICILCLMTTGIPLLAWAAPTGRQIIQEQKNRHSADDETGVASLTLVDRKGKEKHQQIKIVSMTRNNKSKSLIQYLAPANIRGVGLLTWEQGQDKDDDQWLYMSATRTSKRIAGGNKKNQFMGTDMAFEDLRAENLTVHKYSLIGEEPLDGKPCWKIEILPSTEKEKKESGYGRRVVWVEQSNYMTLKALFYDHHSRHIKTALFKDIRLMKGQMFRSFKVIWERIRKKTRTIMSYDTIDIESRHNDTRFTKNFMKRPVK